MRVSQMPAQKLKQILDQRNIKYISINHSPAYTARETAASTFVPRREFAKTIIVDLDGEKVMSVLSASRHVDLAALRSLAGANEARLATEDLKHCFQTARLAPCRRLDRSTICACSSIRW
jgi:Ala-tRNA(Pro) deacylase